MTLKFATLDVFTDRAFAGNPLAVVPDADGLSTEHMQTIAREFNLSETVFVLKPENPAHTARLRIFSPVSEFPFAGHPTLGAAIYLAQRRMPAGSDPQDALVALEEPIGTVRVGVRMRPGTAAFAEFDAPKLPSEPGALPPAEHLGAALGLIPSEIGFENHKPTFVAAGLGFALVPVASLDVMAKLQINMAHWPAAFGAPGILGVYAYTRQCIHTTSACHARMFAPAAGIGEDPATGAAAVCLTSALHHFDKLPDGTHRRLVEQGHEMGRPSLISLTLVVNRGKLDAVRIGGHAVPISTGELVRP